MKAYRRAKLVLALLVATAWLLLLVVAAPAKAADTSPDTSPRPGRPAFIAPVHWATAVCESRGNFRHEVHRADGSYGGAWSWYAPTWRLDRYEGMAHKPWRATPRAQYRVYLRSLARGRDFGCNR